MGNPLEQYNDCTVNVSMLGDLLHAIEKYMNDQDLAYNSERDYNIRLAPAALIDREKHIEFIKSTARLGVYENNMSNLRHHLEEFQKKVSSK